MNYIESAEIEGFWGDKSVHIDFNQEQNFLIGVNGSGKTTLINLISAAIKADFRGLDRIQFDTIIIKFRNRDDRRKRPRLEIIKEAEEFSPFDRIFYRIIFGAKETPFEIYLDELEESRMYRQKKRHMTRKALYFGMDFDQKDLESQLERLFNASWLSIQRIDASGVKDSGFKKSLIDHKINQFSIELSRFLSELKNEADERTAEFQKFFFLSMISVESKSQLYSTLGTIDVEKEKESLKAIYDLLGVDQTDYSQKLNKYFKEYDLAYERRTEKSISFTDAEYLLGMRRIHSVVEKWNNLERTQKQIYRKRDTFLKLINGLLQRKSLFINERNELMVRTQSGKELKLHFLSSGEKQLLILLGDTLLQKSEPHIFIADEPELSLHVDWQEKLVDNLKALNPRCQLIFATHSPDIVSHYRDSIVQVEKLIK